MIDFEINCAKAVRLLPPKLPPAMYGFTASLGDCVGLKYDAVQTIDRMCASIFNHRQLATVPPHRLGSLR